MDYLAVKLIHIVSSTVLFGTGLGSAFYMLMANRRKDISVIYITIRHVVIADWLFTTPAIIIQLISGIWLMHSSGYDLNDKWILYGIALFLFAGVCWLPVVWTQIKMREMAKEAMDKKIDLPDLYWKYNKLWIILGTLAFPAIMIVFYLMVFKPV